MISNQYSIKDLELLSGTKAHTIRIWEKRYNLLDPNRTPTNIRFYSDDDLRRIINISLLVKNKFKISKIATWDKQKIGDTVLKLDKTRVDKSGWIEEMISTILDFREEEFKLLTNKIIKEFGLPDAFQQVFFPFLEKLGIYWLAGAIYPAQEHFVSNVFRQKTLSEIENLKPDDNKEKCVLFFLHEKELHELSLLLYTYLARKKGYKVIYLGTQVPMSDLKRIQEKTKIDMVFTAFINSISLEDLTDKLNELRVIFGSQPVFITGYQVKKLNPTLPRKIKIIKDPTDFDKFF